MKNTMVGWVLYGQPFLPVMPDKYVVPLVVESDHPAALKLGIMWEYGCQEPTHRVAKACREVVEDDLWLMVTHWSMMLVKPEGKNQIIYG